MADKKKLNPTLKLVLDIGPLILFFAANAKLGIYVATGAFMVAVLAALAVAYALTRRIEIMPLVTAVIVLVFGGLTIFLHDELFIKLKPTIIYVLFAGALFFGLAFDKPLLGMVFDSVFNLTEEGWRKLTWRWALFFVFLAVVNEVVWRTQPDSTWVIFRFPGLMILTVLFSMTQAPVMMKHAHQDTASGVDA